MYLLLFKVGSKHPIPYHLMKFRISEQVQQRITHIRFRNALFPFYFTRQLQTRLFDMLPEEVSTPLI